MKGKFMYPSTNSKYVHNMQVSVNLSDLFNAHEKSYEEELFSWKQTITREMRIEALEKDALEFLGMWGLHDQAIELGITLKDLAIDYLNRQ